MWTSSPPASPTPSVFQTEMRRESEFIKLPLHSDIPSLPRRLAHLSLRRMQLPLWPSRVRTARAHARSFAMARWVLMPTGKHASSRSAWSGNSFWSVTELASECSFAQDPHSQKRTQETDAALIHVVHDARVTSFDSYATLPTGLNDFQEKASQPPTATRVEAPARANQDHRYNILGYARAASPPSPPIPDANVSAGRSSSPYISALLWPISFYASAGQMNDR